MIKSLVISGAVIIDGVAEGPVEGRSIWIEGGRIQAIARPDELGAPASVEVIDARGKYIIPGLMDANVHLMDLRPENLARNEHLYEDIIAEAAQVALKSGLTTVFDTLGPRKPLVAVRDRINAGEIPGSRVFCGGNVIGLDGPFSADFSPTASGVFSTAIVERINALYVENVGPALSWMTPEQVVEEVRTYLGKSVDFIKYASSEHRWGEPTAYLVFSPKVQELMVEEAHRAGVTAQAHTCAVEALRVAVEAGCDLIQHCNITGQFPIPQSTIAEMARRRTGAVIFPFTEQRLAWIKETCPVDWVYFSTSDANCRSLMAGGAMLLLATDAVLYAPEMASDPLWSKYWLAPGEDNLNEFGAGHFVWLKAMEEKGQPPMEMLRSATRNIAVAYGKDKDLGTLEPGKIADMLILDCDPLASAANYRSIRTIIKDGAVIDRDALPIRPIQTAPVAEASPETLAYRAHHHIGHSQFPGCC